MRTVLIDHSQLLHRSLIEDSANLQQTQFGVAIVGDSGLDLAWLSRNLSERDAQVIRLLGTYIRVMRLHADGQMGNQCQNLEEFHVGDLRMKVTIE